MVRVTEIYEFGGYGVDVNEQLSLAYYFTSAKYGNVLAMNRLGSFYENVILVHKNYELAMDWYTLVTEDGSSFAEESDLQS